MCMMIHKTNTAKSGITLQACNEMSKANADGLGVIYYKRKSNRIMKTTKYTGRTIYDILNGGEECVLHTRFGTGGETNDKNVHPFDIGNGRFIMMNGVISGMSGDVELCDTAILALSLKGQPYTTVKRTLNAVSGCRFIYVDGEYVETFATFHKHEKTENLLYSNSPHYLFAPPLPKISIGKYPYSYDYGYGKHSPLDADITDDNYDDFDGLLRDLPIYTDDYVSPSDDEAIAELQTLKDAHFFD